VYLILVIVNVKSEPRFDGMADFGLGSMLLVIAAGLNVLAITITLVNKCVQSRRVYYVAVPSAPAE
jgi:hypothetical protein